MSDDQALDEFLKIYRLAPGQNLKHIPLPRPAGSRIYWKRECGANLDDDYVALTFRWSDPDRLRSWAMRVGDSAWTVRDLPRYLEMDVFSTEIDGDPELLKTEVRGDWIYRVGVADERIVGALESILQRALRLRITVKFRQVERDVVVVRGCITMLRSQAGPRTRSRSTASKSCRKAEERAVVPVNSRRS